MRVDAGISRTHTLLGVLGFVVAFIVAGMVAADAHSVSYHYTSERWATDPTMYRGYLTGTLNTDAARAAMYRGDDTWDAVSGSTLDFVDSTYQNPMVLWVNDACLMPNNGVWFLQASISGYGTHQRCTSGSNITKSAIAFDSTGRTWYTGVGTPPSGHTDLWGVSAHELGHAGGWRGAERHLTTSTDCPANSSKHTMCRYWGVAEIPWARGLNTHDSHTVAGAY